MPALQAKLGWVDSNHRMRESKSRALPLGYSPIYGNQSIPFLRGLRLFLPLLDLRRPGLLHRH